MSYQHQHDKGGPELVVRNHFKTSSSSAKVLDERTNHKVDYHNKEEAAEKQVR